MSTEHLSAERLQAFLDGELPGREHTAVEEHLAVCISCASEVDLWRVLFEDLGALASHRPHEGFADRVIAGVEVPEHLPLAARVRKRLGGALPTPAAAHLGETTLQDFLDGALTAKAVARVETHLSECTTCSAQADHWLALQRSLQELGHFSPAEGFADRVMADVEVAEALPLVARVRERVASLVGAPVSAHVEQGRLHDFVDGLLPTRQMARVIAHLDGCPTCATEVEAWQALAARLGRLERFDPTAGFGERVMAEVRVPALAPVAATPTPAWVRVLAYARRAVPRTRRAWAAISGVAVTPAVTVGLVFYAVFSHPTLTPGALASFAWWQITDLAGLAWSAVSSAFIDSSGAFNVLSLFEILAAAPLLVAAGVLAYSLVSAVALRVLYKNLFAGRPMDGRYAHVSAS